MAQTAYPFTNGIGNGTNATTNGQWQELSASYLANGVLIGALNALAVSCDGSGMNAKVASGIAHINGIHYKNDALLTLPIAAADPSNPRVDAVVLRFDIVNSNVYLAVLTGTPATNPQPPNLTQNASTYEMLLAYINVPAGATATQPGNVSDQRSYAQGPGLYVQPQPIVAGTTSNAVTNMFAIGWLAYQLARILGAGANWFDAPVTTLKQAINAAGGTMLGVLQLSSGLPLKRATDNSDLIGFGIHNFGSYTVGDIGISSVNQRSVVESGLQALQKYNCFDQGDGQGERFMVGGQGAYELSVDALGVRVRKATNTPGTPGTVIVWSAWTTLFS